MEATVRERQASQPVGFGHAFRVQLRLLWTSRRPLMLILGLVGVLALAGEPWNTDELARFLHAWIIWALLVGPLWAYAVFHDEGPSDRLYFWAQPVGRTAHALARVAAGLAWLWVAYAVLVLAGLAAGLLEGEAWQLGELGAAAWVNYFVAPAMGYLAVSVLTLTTDHPVRWTLGLIVGFGVLVSLLHETFGLAEKVEWALKPLSEPWGLGLTLVGALGTGVAQVEHIIERMADPAAQYRTTFDVGLWWKAMPLWLLFLVALVAGAAVRHPDTFPRWRKGR